MLIKINDVIGLLLMEQNQFLLILLGILFLLIAYAGIGALFEHKKVHYIHQTGMGIIIGLAFGTLIYFLNGLQLFQFNEEIFFVALLPPMIFAGGYNLKKRKFGQNIKYISIYGVFGTLLSFGIIFALTYLINQLGLIYLVSNGAVHYLSFGLMIKFAATICATDSVAALTLIKPKEYPKLFSIIFGEGMVNDAVAIILFKVVGGIFDDHNTSTDSTAVTIFKVLGSFCLIIFSSLAIGAIMALVCSKLFASFRFLTHNPVIEVVLLYLFGILSYVIAEALDMSGVITVLVCGVCLAHFNFYNLSITGQLCTGVTFQTISFLAQAFVFVYLGTSTLYYATKEQISFSFLGLQLFICFFSRWVMVYLLSFLFSLCSKKWNVSLYEQAVISMAGSIRGSVAFALILTVQNSDQTAVSIVKSTTLFLVFLTTIALGAIMPAFINACLSRDQNALRASLVPIKKGKPGMFKMIDQNYLKPFFIHDYVQRKPEIQQFKRLLKLNSPEYKGGDFVALYNTNVQRRQSIISSSAMPSIQPQKNNVVSDPEDD